MNLVSNKNPGYSQVSEASDHEIIREIHHKGNQVL
jgi:hypothetical protein